MLRTRPFTTQRVYGMSFIFVVQVMIWSIHSSFVYINWWPKLWNLDALAILTLYHIFFANLMISFYQCVMTDPGVVPRNWGFYMGDETKRRRYCKMCNVWKPDRTHHCSICNRCILNMDHHCPWINNCVGFYNRKFFIQLLVYVYASLLVVVLFSFGEVYNRIVALTSHHFLGEDGSTHEVGARYVCASIMLFMSLALSMLLLCTLTNFIRFHVKLVLENYTTIENLERDEEQKSKFDIGSHRNVEQVFGASPMLWWLPLHTQASRPIGDGVRWRVHYTRIVDEDEEVPGDDDPNNMARAQGGGR